MRIVNLCWLLFFATMGWLIGSYKPAPAPPKPSDPLPGVRWQRERPEETYHWDISIVLPDTLRCPFAAREVLITAPGDSITWIAVGGRGTVKTLWRAWR